MAESKTVESKPKKGLPVLVIVGIGCLGLLIVLAIVGTIAAKVIFNNVGGAGTSLLQKAIENKTGIKTDIKDIEQGKLSFTDPKTGSTVDIGSNKLPDSFPKDFPVYPGSKVTSAASGSEKGQGNTLWVTFSTGDSVDKVSTYYKSKLASSGWETTGTYQVGEGVTQSVTKGSWSGTVAVAREGDAKETSIVVMLNEDTSTPSGE
jgi:type II secretory pathway pseudopilin PulG